MQWEIAYRGPYSAVIKLWDGNLQVLAKVNAMSQPNVNDKWLWDCVYEEGGSWGILIRCEILSRATCSLGCSVTPTTGKRSSSNGRMKWWWWWKRVSEMAKRRVIGIIRQSQILEFDLLLLVVRAIFEQVLHSLLRSCFAWIFSVHAEHQTPYKEQRKKKMKNVMSKRLSSFFFFFFPSFASRSSCNR